MSFPIGAGETNLFGINADRTPLTLDESTRTLYKRAISDPFSLTDQERRLVTHRPLPEEENTLCQNACGLSMDELIAKAINSNNNDNNNNDLSLGLSNEEARLLTAGVVQGQSGRILSEVARLSPEDRELKARAMEAARTEDVRAAIEVAQRVRQRWTAVQLAAAKALSNDDIRNIQVAMKVPWQEHVLQSSSTSAGDSSSGGQNPGEAGARFGLVAFYQKEEEEGGGGGGGGVDRLSEYKSQIGTAIYHGLHYSVSLIKDETRNRFTLHWVVVPGSHNNDLDPSALRTRFSTMLANNEIPIGFRRDAFLYVDKEAFDSRETARPYLWLAEPESKPEYETGTTTGAQPGVLPPLKVDIKHIAPTLFARLVQRDLQGEARRKPYRYTSELSRLHAATDATREGDGIWPPPSRLQ
ncbi:hypothetical protein BDV35DRAFT_401315 [Aspergillus flavus]|uniref:Uncharacterized protein n=1 Tax=Aspergillus flavus TaxID=5059 RepID=A0A5N6GHW2_ASPFL|nr:hypothetical protein BDV35DRAFT_401315 [Aspergillus flavus]